MPITFFPGAGMLLICDFSGFTKPEMVKKRPVVVISGRHRRDKLATIVPLSTTAPVPLHDHHHLMDAKSLPGPFALKPTWAECDMVATLSISRLDRVMIRDLSGKRQYISPQVTDEDFISILRGVLCAINLKALTGHVS